MIKSTAGFDEIAPYYDRLKRMVFGDSIDASQRCHLGYLADAGRVLILGGGTGEILRRFSVQNNSCEIWFVDTSSKMLEIAKRQVPPWMANQIIFLHGTVDDLPRDTVFDAVITNFFLDLFPDEKLGEIVGIVAERLGPKGVWLASDFVDNGKYWQRLMLKVMYLFFSVFCGIEARTLPRWEHHLGLARLGQVSSQWFCQGFVKSVVFRKV